MILNLTPHAVNLHHPVHGVIDLPPSGFVARATESTEKVGEADGMPVVRKTYGAATLPPQVKGVWLIVSALTAQAARDRSDLLVVADPVRDEDGAIIGCRALATVGEDPNTARLLKLLMEADDFLECAEWKDIENAQCALDLRYRIGKERKPQAVESLT